MESNKMEARISSFLFPSLPLLCLFVSRPLFSFFSLVLRTSVMDKIRVGYIDFWVWENKKAWFCNKALKLLLFCHLSQNNDDLLSATKIQSYIIKFLENIVSKVIELSLNWHQPHSILGSLQKDIFNQSLSNFYQSTAHLLTELTY